jgi:hypothetical protein
MNEIFGCASVSESESSWYKDSRSNGGKREGIGKVIGVAANHAYFGVHTKGYDSLHQELTATCMCVVTVCMYACACMYVYMYVCIYVCMYVCMYPCMYACMHICVYVSMHACTREYIFDICMYLCIER